MTHRRNHLFDHHCYASCSDSTSTEETTSRPQRLTAAHNRFIIRLGHKRQSAEPGSDSATREGWSFVPQECEEHALVVAATARSSVFLFWYASLISFRSTSMRVGGWWWLGSGSSRPCLAPRSPAWRPSRSTCRGRWSTGWSPAVSSCTRPWD